MALFMDTQLIYMYLASQAVMLECAVAKLLVFDPVLRLNFLFCFVKRMCKQWPNRLSSLQPSNIIKADRKPPVHLNGRFEWIMMTTHLFTHGHIKNNIIETIGIVHWINWHVLRNWLLWIKYFHVWLKWAS